MNLNTWTRRYRADKYTYLASLMTGGYRDDKAFLSLIWAPGLFRVDWKRGRPCDG